MRNLKKLMSVLLIVVVMATMFAVPALAEDTADALTLETLGVLKGTGNGVDAAYRASTPTRYQAAWLFLRLLGKEDDAKGWAGTLNFSDAATAKNAAGNMLNAENQKMLGYLYAHQNLGFRGYADDTFRPFVEVDAQMYYKLMLVALGYVEGTDFTWDTVFAKAIEVGLIAAAPAAGEAFTIDSIADATVATLEATYKGTTDSLIKKLVEVDKALDADKAAASGLYVAPVVELAVTDVKASNMGEIFVTFNKEVDDTKLANFEVDDAAVTATLSADGKVATLVVPTPKANGSTYEVLVKKAIGLAEDYTATITVFDTAKPTVVDIKLTSPNTFDITFSEILAAVNGTIRINNGIYGISSAVRAGKVVTVTIASTTLPDGEYDIEVSGYTDLAGFAMDKVVKKFTYAKDVTKPTATLVRKSQTEIVVRFDEPVTLSATLTNYYHTFAHYVVSSAPTKVAGTEADYAFSFAANGFPIPAGSTTFYIKADAVVDAWGNKMGAVSFPITVDADTTKPSVVSAVYSSGKIVVTFDEPVNTTDATTAANFEVKLGTKSATITGISYDADKMQTTLTLAPLEGGKWTIVVKNVKDLSLAGNVVNENVNMFTVADEIPIDTTKVKATIVIGAAGGNDVIYLTYPEAMNDTALDPSYYMLKTGAITSLLSAKTVKIEANGATGYKITRAHDADLVAGTSVLSIGRVQDANGNAPLAFSFDVVLAPEVAPAVVAVKQTDYNKVEVTFDKVLTDYTLEAFRFSVDGVVYHTPAMFDNVVTKDGKTTLSFIITADLITAIKTVSADYEDNTAEVIGVGPLAGVTLELVAGKVTSASGMKNASAMIQALNTDARAPKLVDVQGFNLVFSEPIVSANPAYLANDLVLKKDNEVLIPGVDYTTALTVEGHIAITAPGGAATVETAAAINVIADAAKNKAQAFTAEKFTAVFTSPTLSSKIHDNGGDVGGVYMLPSGALTGDFSIEFDVTLLDGINTGADGGGYIGFMPSKVLPYYTPSGAYYITNNAILNYYENGVFKFVNSTYNGGDTNLQASYTQSWANSAAVVVGTTYRIKNVVHLRDNDFGGYEAFIDYGDGAGYVQVGPDDMGFRCNGGFYGPVLVRTDVTQAADIAAINITDYVGGKIKVENLVITDLN